MKLFKSSCISIFFVLIFMHVSWAQTGAVQINLSEQDPYGQFLVDGQGKSLYLFLKDSSVTSSCYDDCAVAWPPVLTSNENITAGEGVQSSLLGTIKRNDGSLQVTYNSHPLYYYENDKKAGDVEGQDKDDYGAEWYLVKPNGEKMGDVEK